MAVIFAVIACSMLAILAKKHLLAMILIATGIFLSLLMFWHHATDILKINL